MPQVKNRIIRRRLMGAWISSIVSICLVLLLVGVASRLLVNARRLSDYFKEHTEYLERMVAAYAIGFSITSVACPHCGGSFDAVRQKICPYYGSTYHMENEGWVIEEMKLIR